MPAVDYLFEGILALVSAPLGISGRPGYYRRGTPVGYRIENGRIERAIAFPILIEQYNSWFLTDHLGELVDDPPGL